MIDCTSNLLLLIPFFAGIILIGCGVCRNNHNLLFLSIGITLSLFSMFYLFFIDQCVPHREFERTKELSSVQSMSCDELRLYNHNALNPNFEDYVDVKDLAYKKYNVDCLK